MSERRVTSIKTVTSYLMVVRGLKYNHMEFCDLWRNFFTCSPCIV